MTLAGAIEPANLFIQQTAPSLRTQNAPLRPGRLHCTTLTIISDFTMVILIIDSGPSSTVLATVMTIPSSGLTDTAGGAMAKRVITRNTTRSTVNTTTMTTTRTTTITTTTTRTTTITTITTTVTTSMAMTTTTRTSM